MGFYMKQTGILIGKLGLNLWRRPLKEWLKLNLTPRGGHTTTWYDGTVHVQPLLSDTFTRKNIGFPS